LGACLECPKLKFELDVRSLNVKKLETELLEKSHSSVTSSPCEVCVSLKGKLVHDTNENTVTPHVSKPHDYVNHMFMRSVDQIRSLESNSKFSNSGLMWTIRLGCRFFIINRDRVSLHFQNRICS
jgi:hypothetical protein